MRECPLGMDSSLARRRELSQVGETPSAHLLGQSDQVDEHLSRRLCVRKRTVTRLGRHAEEVSERGEADAAKPAFEQAARERGGAERRLGEATAVQLLLEEALIEPGVVRHEQVVAGEGEEAPDDAADGGCSPQLLLAQAGEAGHVLGEGNPRIDERLEGADRLERANADGSDLADLVRAAESPVVSRSKTTNSASSSSGSARFPARETVAPVQTMRLSPAVTSSRSEQARPSGIDGVANSSRAASTADKTPCSSSASTSRSSPSSASCIPR